MEFRLNPLSVSDENAQKIPWKDCLAILWSALWPPCGLYIFVHLFFVSPVLVIFFEGTSKVPMKISLRVKILGSSTEPLPPIVSWHTASSDINAWDYVNTRL